MAKNTSPQAQLRKDCLGIWEVVAQSVASVAPTATPAMVIGLAYASAGNATWFSYLLATTSMLLVTFCMSKFAIRSRSPGAYYTYVSEGLGPTMGVTCGWALVIAYFAIVVGCLVSISLIFNVFVETFFGTQPLAVTRPLFIILAALAIWWITFKDIKLSTRVMLGSELLSIGLIVLLIALYFITGGQLIDRPQLRLEGLSSGAFNQGFVLAILSFIGFESAATLGWEAKTPSHSVPKAMYQTVFFSGLFFIVSSYAMISAFRGHTPGLAQSEAPLVVLSSIAKVPFFGYLLTFGAGISFFAGAIGLTNGGARILYVMSRHGLFHQKAGRAHTSNSTPHVAICIGSVVSLAIALGMYFSGLGLRHIYDLVATFSTYGFIGSYILVCVAAFAYETRQAKNKCDVRVVIAAVAATLVLLVPLVGSVYPVPEYPMNTLPYIFILLLGMGVARFVYLKHSRPGLVIAMEKDLETSIVS